MRDEIDHARSLRAQTTDAEARLWMHLRRNQINGLHFRRQVPIGAYIVDFACRKASIVIEIDGGQHSDTVEADGRRTAYLQSRGFTVLRFWNNDVLQETDTVLESIRAALVTPPP